MDFFDDTELDAWDGNDPASNPPSFFKVFVEDYKVAVENHLKLAKLSSAARLRQLEVLQKAKERKKKET